MFMKTLSPIYVMAKNLPRRRLGLKRTIRSIRLATLNAMTAFIRGTSELLHAIAHHSCSTIRVPHGTRLPSPLSLLVLERTLGLSGMLETSLHFRLRKSSILKALRLEAF